ncbi:Arm DNA-binding domain-containing protein [Burkholderia ambifaria]|uniref:Arm DNA-binding domain-containing protein n=1 Tax=Burkholderia ambifaria TaxID=152480 RepID=UPI00338F7A40
MTICLITSFAPVRGGSAIRLEPLPVGHQVPFHRLLTVVGNRGERSKKRVAKRGRFRTSNDDTRLFTVPFTDVEIRQAKVGNKPTKLTEGNGLYLLVKPSGSRLWRYKYRIAGKENLFAIGEYSRRARRATVPAKSSRRDRTPLMRDKTCRPRASTKAKQPLRLTDSSLTHKRESSA